MRLRKTIASILACLILCATGSATAAEFLVSQNKKQFTPKQLNIKRGDNVVFVNDDRFMHNLFSDTAGFEFNIRKQKPGEKHEIVFRNRGKFVVKCVIHPRMKLTIKVD